MRRCMLLIAALAALVTGAQARIITYTWNQISTTKPGLVFTASYRVIQGAAPLPANSFQISPNFGGLVDFYIEGGGYPVITLADLVPSCDDPSGCMIAGQFHDFGSPNWQINVPSFFYLAATELSADPWHFEWNYIVTANSITLGDDNANAGCFNQFDCYATGFWSSNFVPEPWPVFAFLGGLALISLRRARSGVAKRSRIGKPAR